MTMAKEHLRFAAIARTRGDERQRQKHLLLAEEAQEKCDGGRCECAVKCKPIAPAFESWAQPFGKREEA